MLVDPQLGVSAIALPLAHRWWQKVDVGERMQGVLATQFDGVFYCPPGHRCSIYRNIQPYCLNSAFGTLYNKFYPVAGGVPREAGCDDCRRHNCTLIRN